MEKPAVGIVMGSQSDLRIMKEAAEFWKRWELLTNSPLFPPTALPFEWLTSYEHRQEPAESACNHRRRGWSRSSTWQLAPQ
jgi:phosphoribosylcarboxyaminoimidazole (NCAIR) mutase